MSKRAHTISSDEDLDLDLPSGYIFPQRAIRRLPSRHRPDQTIRLTRATPSRISRHAPTQIAQLVQLARPARPTYSIQANGISNLGVKPAVGFSTYRSISLTSSSEGISEVGDSDNDTELGTALSDVESDLEPFQRDLSSPMRESDEVESALPIASSPKSETEFWMNKGDLKGKRRVLDYGLGQGGLKRALEVQVDSDCEADDELGPAVTKRRRPQPLKLQSCSSPSKRTCLAPTKSIMDITRRVDNIDPSMVDEQDEDAMTETSDDDEEDYEMVSASLAIIPDSPTPLPKHLAFKPLQYAQAKPPHRSAQTSLRRFFTTSHQPHDPRPIRQLPRKRNHNEMARNSFRLASIDEVNDTMTTSEAELDFARDKKKVVRRLRLQEFPERLPGQFTSANLRRKSPSSLLPLREKRTHLKNNYARSPIYCGQLVLDEMHRQRAQRQLRCKAMKGFNERFELECQGAKLLPTAPIKPVFHFVAPARRRTVDTIWQKRMARDQTRRNADRNYRALQTQIPRRATPPIISPSFTPLALLSPGSIARIEAARRANQEEENVVEREMQVGDDTSELDSEAVSARSDVVTMSTPSSPTMSEPPEYEEQPPDLPISLPIPPSRRPPTSLPPPVRPVPVDAPRYVWLNTTSGGEYTRRSPPPPPPFNAQTDSEIVVPARFDDDGPASSRIRIGASGRDVMRDLNLWDDPDFVAPVISPIRDGRADRGISPEREMIGSFPAPQRLSTTTSPAVQLPLLAPQPVRSISVSRSTWEAALDLEEGEGLGGGYDDDEDDDIEGELDFQEGEPEEGREQEEGQRGESRDVVGRLGRLVRSVWRW